MGASVAGFFGATVHWETKIGCWEEKVSRSELVQYNDTTFDVFVLNEIKK